MRNILIHVPGIYGVGKAAVHEPALAVLSHTPPGATENICWVGKGIVYDTGGLSIKGKVSGEGGKSEGEGVEGEGRELERKGRGERGREEEREGGSV